MPMAIAEKNSATGMFTGTASNSPVAADSQFPNVPMPGRFKTPASAASAARITSGMVITRGDSWACSAIALRGLPKNTMTSWRPT